jgi:hypothetical protein
VSRATAEALWGEAVVEAMLSRGARPPSPALLQQIREAATCGPSSFARWALGQPLTTFVCIVHLVAGEALHDLLTPLRSVS